MIYFQLFYEFFKTGLFVFGGGLATIPFLQEISEKTGWFTIQQLMDMIAISEATPGPIGVNMATYVGYTVAGLTGGIVATLGLITPSIIIACIIARLLYKFKDSQYIDAAFYGLRPASLALICSAGLAVLRLSLFQEALWQDTGLLISLFNFKGICLALVIFALSNKFKNLHPVAFLAASAVIGMVFRF
ncbi:MAG: chromate transporter [Oscillospiraceae bacterium]|nr:chromate transporter [Oscillospiraceae bacterium]